MERISPVRSKNESFIVRLWRDVEAATWRGEVEHVLSGERRLFIDDSALLRFLDTWRQPEPEE